MVRVVISCHACLRAAAKAAGLQKHATVKYPICNIADGKFYMISFHGDNLRFGGKDRCKSIILNKIRVIDNKILRIIPLIDIIYRDREVCARNEGDIFGIARIWPIDARSANKEAKNIIELVDIFRILFRAKYKLEPYI